jgi:hypothetical protein
MSNDKYKNIVLKALKNVKNGMVTENRIKYNESQSERIIPEIEKALRERKHSLGDHPAFPHSDESHFEEKILGRRFENVVNNVKRQFETDNINNDFMKNNMQGMVRECMKLEAPHKKQLEQLAVEMIRKEFDMGEDDVDVIVELVDSTGINMEGTSKNPSPVISEMEFDDHGSIENANGEVYKRRFLNAMIQGSAKKSSHMFNLEEEVLSGMDPRLPRKYNKMMSAADYMYYIVDNMEDQVNGGVVRVKFPQNEGEKPVIHAKAMVFPVLVHELVKGVMEVLSSHGLPEDNNLKEYVIGKSDYLAAETWDMRLGPAIWEKFTECIDAEDFGLKHHVYSELATLPVNEFNTMMREIMAGTKNGKAKIKNILDEVKSDLQQEEFNQSMNERRNSHSDYIDDPDELDDIDLSNFGL